VSSLVVKDEEGHIWVLMGLDMVQKEPSLMQDAIRKLKVLEVRLKVSSESQPLTLVLIRFGRLL